MKSIHLDKVLKDFDLNTPFVSILEAFSSVSNLVLFLQFSMHHGRKNLLNKTTVRIAFFVILPSLYSRYHFDLRSRNNSNSLNNSDSGWINLKGKR